MLDELVRPSKLVDSTLQLKVTVHQLLSVRVGSHIDEVHKANTSLIHHMSHLLNQLGVLCLNLVLQLSYLLIDDV